MDASPEMGLSSKFSTTPNGRMSSGNIERQAIESKRRILKASEQFCAEAELAARFIAVEFAKRRLRRYSLLPCI